MKNRYLEDIEQLAPLIEAFGDSYHLRLQNLIKNNAQRLGASVEDNYSPAEQLLSKALHRIDYSEHYIMELLTCIEVFDEYFKVFLMPDKNTVYYSPFIMMCYLRPDCCHQFFERYLDQAPLMIEQLEKADLGIDKESVGAQLRTHMERHRLGEMVGPVEGVSKIIKI